MDRYFFPQSHPADVKFSDNGQTATLTPRSTPGLTKRELFAAMVMAKIAVVHNKKEDINLRAYISVLHADALINELEKERSSDGGRGSDKGLGKGPS